MFYKLVILMMPAKTFEAFDDIEFCCTRTIEYHKAAAACAGNFSATRTSLFSSCINFFHQRIRYAVSHESFLLVTIVKYLAKFIQSSFEQGFLHHLRLLLELVHCIDGSFFF